VLSRSTLTALAGALISFVLLAGAAGAEARLPRDFFGIAPQTPIAEADVGRMRHGGLDVVRVDVGWPEVQPGPRSDFDWTGLDHVVAVTARAHLDVLPFLYASPHWVAGRRTSLPVSSPRQRRAWAAFLRAAVERYGPRGEFWAEHASGDDFVPRTPIRTWQIWNEENFFYFATPASPQRYARLLKLSHRVIRSVDGRARIVLGGLFGNPKERPPRAMDAADFLDRLYRVRGIRAGFEGVALHPYAKNTAVLRRLTESLRRVVVRHRDRRTGLYVTEMGWGSQRNPRRVAFEVGLRPQARELRQAYRYLIRNRRRLNLKQVYWFTWKDATSRTCSFCDSTGLFRHGARFRPKPAWRAMVAVTHGRR
jgi:hypothetical protein